MFDKNKQKFIFSNLLTGLHVPHRMM